MLKRKKPHINETKNKTRGKKTESPGERRMTKKMLREDEIIQTTE